MTVWVPSFVEYFYIAHGKFTGRSLSPAAYGANKSIFRGHRGRLKIQIPPGVQARIDNVSSSGSSDDVQLLPQPSPEPATYHGLVHS